jgi:hypothetical protein
VIFEGGRTEEGPREGVALGEQGDASPVGEAIHKCEAGADLDDVVDASTIEPSGAQRGVVRAPDGTGGPGQTDHEVHRGAGSRIREEALIQLREEGFHSEPRGRVGVRAGEGPDGADEWSRVDGIVVTQVPRVGDRSVEALVEGRDGDRNPLFEGAPEDRASEGDGGVHLHDAAQGTRMELHGRDDCGYGQ